MPDLLVIQKGSVVSPAWQGHHYIWQRRLKIKAKNSGNEPFHLNYLKGLKKFLEITFYRKLNYITIPVKIIKSIFI